MTAVVAPLGSIVFSEDFLKESCVGEGDRDFPASSWLHKFSYEHSGDSLLLNFPKDYWLHKF